MKMIKVAVVSMLCILCFAATAQHEAIAPKKRIVLFNGNNLDGWDGNQNIWSVRDGVIAAGSKTDKQLQNEFLSTKTSYKNYELELKFMIVGYSGFVNAGIQLHSQRMKDPAHEMIGFQADIGSDCMGSLYDESRRNKYLANADQMILAMNEEWNTYRMVCKENTITLFINGKQTISYEERDPSVPMLGKIGLQIHGDGVLEVFYKDIVMKPLE